MQADREGRVEREKRQFLQASYAIMRTLASLYFSTFHYGKSQIHTKVESCNYNDY